MSLQRYLHDSKGTSQSARPGPNWVAPINDIPHLYVRRSAVMPFSCGGLAACSPCHVTNTCDEWTSPDPACSHSLWQDVIMYVVVYVSRKLVSQATALIMDKSKANTGLQQAYCHSCTRPQVDRPMPAGPKHFPNHLGLGPTCPTMCVSLHR